MSRLQMAYEVADVAAAAESLRDQLGKLERLPSHVELLNMLARAAGYRNFQHFRANAKAKQRLDAPTDHLPIDHDRVEKVARHFGIDGQLLRYPARESQQVLCLWALWSRIPAGASLTEQEISALLDHWHVFGDHALLRRALVDYGLVSRTVDGRQYLRIEQKPPAELAPLLARLSA